MTQHTRLHIHYPTITFPPVRFVSPLTRIKESFDGSKFVIFFSFLCLSRGEGFLTSDERGVT